MNDLESRIRDAFRGHEGDAPAFDPSEMSRVSGRTRRRQVLNATVAGIGALVAVVVLTAGLGQLLRADGTPADQSPPVVVSGALAYALDGDIYVADPDGTNPVRITDVAALDDEECRGELRYWLPSWSPDGRYLAFRGPRDEGCASPTGVVITDPQGNVVATFPVRDQPSLTAPEWSPDSTRVAVWDEYKRTIGVYGIDGTRQTHIALPPGWRPGDLGELAWMPDGASLIVDQYEVPLDGGTPRELPFPFTEFSSQPQRYSPDGSLAAYGTRHGLMVARPDGSEPRAVFGQVPYSWTWSPTGELIALTADVPGAPWAPNQLHVVDVAIGSATLLFEGDRRTTFVVIGFSPAGDRVLFWSIENASLGPESLWSVGVDGSDARQVVGETIDGAWRPV